MLDHISAACPWQVCCLQETLRKLEGVDSGTHALFTPSALEGGLRCPAVVVHASASGSARQSGEGLRWVAVDMGPNVVVISAHLPHLRKPSAEFSKVLEELDRFLETKRGKSLVIGMDANVRLSSLQDVSLVGPAVPASRTAQKPAELEKVAALYEFMLRWRLMAANTFADETSRELLNTRHDWDT